MPNEKPYACSICGRTYKTWRGVTNHLKTKHPDENEKGGIFSTRPDLTMTGPKLDSEPDTTNPEEIERYLTLTPEPEEVSPQGDQGQGDFDTPIKPSTAPDTIPGWPPDLPGPETFPSTQEMLTHVMKQIETLGENDQKLQTQLTGIQKNMYEATQSAEAAKWSLDDIPEWLRPGISDAIGAVGSFLRGFHSGGESTSEDELVIKAAVKLMRENADERIAARAALIATAMEDPDSEVFVRKKEAEKTEPG